MSFSLNRIMLIGNLGNDAKVESLANDKTVTKFSIATTESYKKNDKWINITTWHNVVVWNPSNFLLAALKKGKKFYVDGKLNKHDYTDKDEIKRQSIEVIADTIISLNTEANNE